MKKQLLILLLMISACDPIVDNRGYVRQDDFASKITVGQTSKQEVFDQFGSPSSQSSFGDETWYYIQNRKETMGFFAPETVDQDVTRVEFNTAGIVTKIEAYGKDQAQKIENVSRETPTEGHTLGFIEQVMSNVGRFNKPGGPTGAAVPGRKPSSY